MVVRVHQQPGVRSLGKSPSNQSLNGGVRILQESPSVKSLANSVSMTSLLSGASSRSGDAHRDHPPKTITNVVPPSAGAITMHRSMPAPMAVAPSPTPMYVIEEVVDFGLNPNMATHDVDDDFFGTRCITAEAPSGLFTSCNGASVFGHLKWW